MSGNAVRLQAIMDVEAYVPPAHSFDETEAPGEVFGRNVFTKAEMQKRLPKSVFKSVMATIERGAKLDPIIADAVAAAMKDWALDKGATHYAHVFYPLTGLTAEKHDSFLEPGSDGSRSPTSPARSSSRASRTRRASPTAACATRSRRAATRAGTSRARPTCWRTRTATRCASRPSSCR